MGVTLKNLSHEGDLSVVIISNVQRNIYMERQVTKFTEKQEQAFLKKGWKIVYKEDSIKTKTHV